MGKQDDKPSILTRPTTRRNVLTGAMTGGVALSMASSQVFAAGTRKTLKIGFISPRSGKLAGFGETDPYILGLARQALADGITINGQSYAVEIIDRDSQSDPSRASQLAKELISKDKVDLMLAASTPEVTNPVADACEAAGVPNLATLVPWEAFYFGRGARPGQPSPFKWTFVFSFGVGVFNTCYQSLWDSADTNKKVAVMYPNDADGNAIRENLIPLLEKGGYKIIDPGAYEDGTTDFSSQIATFRREKCEIFNSFPIPSDFDRFWRQAAQQHLTDQIKVAQINKSCQFPFQVEPLGPLGYGLASTAAWTPVFPYTSPLTGAESQKLADNFEADTGEQWRQQLGTTLSLLDVGFEALKASGDPTNKDAVRKAIASLDCQSMVGNVNFNDGPVPNVSITPQVSTQWVKAAPDSRFKLDLVTVGHADDPNVPIQQEYKPYNT